MPPRTISIYPLTPWRKTKPLQQVSILRKPSFAKEKQRYLPKKSLGFWAIIFALCAAGLLTALETTVASTALPTIVDDLGGADLYVWIVNGFFLAM